MELNDDDRLAAITTEQTNLKDQQSDSGLPIVFLHGYLMGANLWDPVVRRLDGEFRCVTPELPFGAQPQLEAGAR